jgi:hypothetical protein
MYAVNPNPASSGVTISTVEDSTAGSSGSVKRTKPIGSVRVVDRFGRTVARQTYSGETLEARIDISGLPAGLYIIRVNEGAEEESHTLVKE